MQVQVPQNCQEAQVPQIQSGARDCGVRGEAASGQASQATSVAKLDKPPATLTPRAPTAPTNNDSLPAVTGDLQDNSSGVMVKIQHTQTGQRRQIPRDEVLYHSHTSVLLPSAPPFSFLSP